VHGAGVCGEEQVERADDGQGIDQGKAAGQVADGAAQPPRDLLRERAVGRGSRQHQGGAELPLQALRHVPPACPRPLLDRTPPAGVQADQRAVPVETLRGEDLSRAGAIVRGEQLHARARTHRLRPRRDRHRAPVLLDPGDGLVEGHDMREQPRPSGVGVADARARARQRHEP
jgi:hypothetical protein